MSAGQITYQRDTRGIAVCGLIILGGLLVLYASRSYTMLGSVFPRTVAVLMIILSVLYMIQAVRHPKPVSVPTGGSTLRRVLLFATMLIWALLLEHVGFLSTSLVAYALILMIANFKPWSARSVIQYFGSGAAVVILLYLLFSQVLQVPLPVGILL